MNPTATVTEARPARQAERAGTSSYASWLELDDVVLGADVADRRGAIAIASVAVAERHGLDPAPIDRALWRRELAGSTALGHGIAIPHARIDGIARPLTFFMRPRVAVEFAAPDGRPVSDMLVILVPTDGDPDDHLQFLALVARMFSEGDFRARLRGADAAADVRRLFSDAARRLA